MLSFCTDSPQKVSPQHHATAQFRVLQKPRSQEEYWGCLCKRSHEKSFPPWTSERREQKNTSLLCAKRFDKTFGTFYLAKKYTSSELLTWYGSEKDAAFFLFSCRKENGLLLIVILHIFLPCTVIYVYWQYFGRQPVFMYGRTYLYLIFSWAPVWQWICLYTGMKKILFYTVNSIFWIF